MGPKSIRNVVLYKLPDFDLIDVSRRTFSTIATLGLTTSITPQIVFEEVVSRVGDVSLTRQAETLTRRSTNYAVYRSTTLNKTFKSPSVKNRYIAS